MMWVKKRVDEYLDDIINKVGKGQGGQKNKNQENGEDLTQMIADLKR